MTATEELVTFVASTDSIPAETAERSTVAVRDLLGVALAGTASDVGGTLRGYADASPAEASGTTVAGAGENTPPATVVDGTAAGAERACLLNGAYGHAVDFDDTFATFPLHPTTVVAPAALTAGELADADGDEFLRAFAVGVETLYRVGRSVFPTQYQRGFHSTAAVGPLGAAAAAGVLLDLDPEELRHAFGVAASSAGGLRKNFGTTTKPLHAGFAASAGLRAVLLARAGATADRNILDGETGYGRVMAGADYDPGRLAESGFAGVDDIALKLYPSAHITHGSMEAVRQVCEGYGLGPGDVESVTATMHPGGEDVLVHDDPRTGLAAKFSIEFCLAAVLREGAPGLAAFTDDYVTAPATRAAMGKVEGRYDANAVADLGRYGGRVTVETTEGTTYEAAADAPGSPENPASEDRLREKFDACVAGTGVDADRLADAVTGLADGGSVADVTAALRRG